jgi:hypothetical protein
MLIAISQHLYRQIRTANNISCHSEKSSSHELQSNGMIFLLQNNFISLLKISIIQTFLQRLQPCYNLKSILTTWILLFRSTQILSDRPWCLSNLLHNWYCGCPTVFTLSKREADHSPPSSAEVKNAWNYTSTPLTRLYGAMFRHRENFTKTRILSSLLCNVV